MDCLKKLIQIHVLIRSRLRAQSNRHVTLCLQGQCQALLGSLRIPDRQRGRCVRADAKYMILKFKRSLSRGSCETLVKLKETHCKTQIVGCKQRKTPTLSRHHVTHSGVKGETTNNNKKCCKNIWLSCMNIAKMLHNKCSNTQQVSHTQVWTGNIWWNRSKR